MLRAEALAEILNSIWDCRLNFGSLLDQLLDYKISLESDSNDLTVINEIFKCIDTADKSIVDAVHFWNMKFDDEVFHIDIE